MSVSFNSYYLYKKYEKRGDQPWLPVYPETLSIDGDGSMPKVLKTSGDPACQPIYRLVETEDTICVEVFDKKYELTLSDSSTVTGACDATSALTRSEISAYSASVTSAIIGDCVTSIGDDDYHNAPFYNCTNLTSVTIPNSVVYIGYQAFYNCSSLTSFTIPDSLTSIDDYAFQSCDSLTSLYIPSGLTSIGFGVFEWCNSLTSITVDNNNTNYDSRNNCNAIIETNTNTLIKGCVNTVIPDTVTVIGDSAFIGITNLTAITIPNGVTTIDRMAFYNCTGLTSINISNSVTRIGRNAFTQCKSLTSVTIPSGVTSIGVSAFYYCLNLESITCEATTPPILEGNPFFQTNNCPIYVPAASLTDYQTAWSEYSSRIQAII